MSSAAPVSQKLKLTCAQSRPRLAYMPYSREHHRTRLAISWYQRAMFAGRQVERFSPRFLSRHADGRRTHTSLDLVIPSPLNPQATARLSACRKPETLPRPAAESGLLTVVTPNARRARPSRFGRSWQLTENDGRWNDLSARGSRGKLTASFRLARALLLHPADGSLCGRFTNPRRPAVRCARVAWWSEPGCPRSLLGSSGQ